MAIFGSSNQSYLGVDIGSSSIKVVELKNEKGRPKLVTYGYMEQSSQILRSKTKESREKIAKDLKLVIESMHRDNMIQIDQLSINIEEKFEIQDIKIQLILHLKEKNLDKIPKILDNFLEKTKNWPELYQMKWVKELINIFEHHQVFKEPKWKKILKKIIDIASEFAGPAADILSEWIKKKI